jgi:hypothetical protein
VATCTWDSGSATGNRPACDRRATQVSTVTCYGGPLEVRLCDEHAPLLAARIYPDTVLSVVKLSGNKDLPTSENGHSV